jgi:hypothetical protein
MYMCPIPNGFRDRAISLCSTLYAVQKNNTSYSHKSFFIIIISGVGLSPLGTAATSWPIVQAPDDR